MLVSVDVTFLLRKEKEDVVFDVEWDELFFFCVFMVIFAVHWNHETTVGSQVEIFRPFARDFSSSAHTLCTPVSQPFKDRHKPFPSQP